MVYIVDFFHFFQIYASASNPRVTIGFYFLVLVFHFVLSVVSTDFDGDPAIVIMGLEPSVSHHNGYCFLSLDEIERLIMDGFSAIPPKTFKPSILARLSSRSSGRRCTRCCRREA